MLIRLNKFLADCGIASRRKAETQILAGLVKVNNKTITKLGTKIDPLKDKVYFNNKPINPQNNIYIMLNKPKGYTCTTRSFKKEKNILDLVKIKEKVFPVGRLDKISQGLVFLTNDGDWANTISHPKFEIEKEYHIIIQETQDEIRKNLNKMKKGIKDHGELLKIKSYKINGPTSVNLILTQGHKREIRRLFDHFNYEIKELKRVRIAKWKLDSLAEGKWEYFQPK